MSGMFALHRLSCHILFMPCILFEEPFYSIPIFSLVILRNICIFFFLGWQLKHVRRLLFCLGISKPLSMRTGLALPYMLGNRCHFLFHKHAFVFFVLCLIFQQKKKFGEKMRNFISFFSFSDIACAFAWYLSSLCID
jgi:hypothetical protein